MISVFRGKPRKVRVVVFVVAAASLDVSKLMVASVRSLSNAPQPRFMTNSLCGQLEISEIEKVKRNSSTGLYLGHSRVCIF